MNTKPKGRPFDKCFIDADSIIYRIALKDITLDLAKKYYDEEIENIGWDTCSSDIAVAVKGENNFRYNIEENYKGKPGDIRVNKVNNNKYDFYVRGEDGWHRDTNSSYAPVNVPLLAKVCASDLVNTLLLG